MTQALEHLLTTSFLVLNHATQNVFYTSIGGGVGGGGGRRGGGGGRMRRLVCGGTRQLSPIIGGPTRHLLLPDICPHYREDLPRAQYFV